MAAQVFCFGSIILCYSYYGHLQEKLIADKSLNLSASMIMLVQYVIAVIIASTILIVTGPSEGQSVFG